MKEFIFDENKRCVNPNRYECGDKDFWVEIQTARFDGKWYCGHQYYTNGRSFDKEVYRDTYSFQTESEAISREVEILSKFLKNDFEKIFRYLSVPDSIYIEMLNLKENAKHPQLSIF